MRNYLVIAMLLFAPNAFAKDKTGAKVLDGLRPVSQSSVDVFAVLTRLIEAKADYASGDFAAAFDGYRYVYLHDKAQAEAALGYADAALAIGQVDLAQKLYRTLALNSVRAKTGEILCAVIKNETKFPEEALRARLEIDSDDGRLWNSLGRVLDQKNQGPRARQAYVMAGMTGQRAGLAQNNIGKSFMAEGNYDKALENFTRAVIAAPTASLFDNNRRLTLLLKQQYAAALRGTSGPQATRLLKDAGRLAAQQSDKKLARFFFEKAQALSTVYDPQLEDDISKLG